MIYYCIESLSIFINSKSIVTIYIYVIITYHYIIVSHMQYDVRYIITANPGLLLPARNDGGSVIERLPLLEAGAEGGGWAYYYFITI